MKKLLAVAVATAISAPAMADMTIYGTVAVDFIKGDVATSDVSNVERDDVVFGMKGSSQTDAGLNVSAEVKTEGDFTSPTLAYLKVDNGTVALWGGKFGSPADAADTVDYSNTGNVTYFSGEVDNAVGVTLSSNGFSAGIGAVRNGTTNEGTVAQLGYAVDGLSINFGMEETSNTVTTTTKALKVNGVDYVGTNETDFGFDYKATGVKVAYAMDALTVGVAIADGEYTSVETPANKVEVETTTIFGSYAMGNTTLSAFYAQDEAQFAADPAVEMDTTAFKVAQNLGGGLSAYAEYSINDSDTEALDGNNVTIGGSFSF
ncbi:MULTISPECIES: hypothetical protein [unclassified Marinobacterium]|uniref:hypothetical protein n=1 Tax=unclassified Marinobacterium TaxID=2644139 RepID=UPI0015692759|nr:MULTISPECIES: hypothetical protein [unclassified Marinobacterium]NRP57837.1 hypothetical protein [Marinobacterium sp. xm-d-510]NRP97272.1 hypothetical protein [Marinobacterium sp. xm-a-127]